MNDFQRFLDQSLAKIDMDILKKTEVETLDYDVYSEIREQVTAIRKEKGMTQKQLSQETGLSQANISNIEKGQNKPTIDTLKKIADATGKRLIIEFQSRKGIM